MAQAAPQATDDDTRRPRGGPLHWAVTAVVLAAVTAGVVLARPAAGAGAQPGTAAKAAPVADSRIPLDCGPVGIRVAKRITADLDHDGRPDTAVLAHCNAGTGSPPDGLYLYTPAADASAKPLTLLDPRKGLTVKKLDLSGGQLHAAMLGYSSGDVPRCCPDLTGDVHWEWDSGIFRIEGNEPAGGLTQAV